MLSRNFCIIAHIDHGKSTLADRFLELTKTVPTHQMRERILDQMDLERERGITIKLQPVTMRYNNVSLNLIDTPGHVDFQYEVGRSLAAVEGAILLVDATNGVMAQTISNWQAAQKLNLTIIPAVNKIDAPAAETERVVTELAGLLGIKPSQVSRLSAKTGQGVKELLERVIKEVPPPITAAAPTRLLVFDSLFDSFRGVIAYVRVVSGELTKRESLFVRSSSTATEALEIGIFTPTRQEKTQLVAGDIGYVVTSLKDVRGLRVGDTLVTDMDTPPLSGYRVVQPTVYASLFPLERSEINALREALGKLALNDAALTYVPENNPALGSGFRCGFLGALHLDIVKERLAREAQVEIIAGTPTVAYRLTMNDGRQHSVTTAADFPDVSRLVSTEEPIANVELVLPANNLGAVLQLLPRRRGYETGRRYLDAERVILTAVLPLAEIIVNFHDEIKSITSGYGSYHYKLAGYRPEPLSRLDFMVGGELIHPLSQIVPRVRLESIARTQVARLKELIPRQNIAIAVQAAVGGKIIARETIAALRKDVTAKLYGGDITRKRKLLEKQKSGKKRMALFGHVSIPPSVFIDVLRAD